MLSLEQQYYESDAFWAKGNLQDPANKERFRITANMILPTVKTLADIGCGNGEFVHHLLENKKQILITAVDRSEAALKYVRVNSVRAEINNLPFENLSFDCVTCLEVIEHLPIPIYLKSLQELARVAKTQIIISVPFAEILEDSYTCCPACKTIFNKEIHLRNFSEADIGRLLVDSGFKCVSYQKLNKRTRFVGHKFYRKLFYPEQFKTWDAPICPLCGFEKKISVPSIQQDMVRPARRKWITYLSSLPKLFWPKKSYYYWIVASYQRMNPTTI